MKGLKYIIIVIVIAIPVVAFLTRGDTQESTTATEGVVVEQMDSGDYWVERIKEVGGEAAHEAFKEANAAYDVNGQHTNAHVFGGALFEALGLEGTTVCDASFSYGCYHEYLGHAIQTHGIESVYDLNEVCVENLKDQALSCQHGIGHGIQSYYGYKEDGLLKGLAVCKDLPYSDPIGGCYGGLFMEYNMRTMLRLDGVGARKPEDPENLHEPCDEVEADQLPACYYWQPQWWFSTLLDAGNDDAQAFKRMGELCRDLDDSTLVRKCFEGIGNITPQSSGYDPEVTITLCQSAAATDAQEVYCRSDAANSFHAVPNVREQAPLVCKGLTGERKEFCYGHSINKFNQVNAPESIE